EERRVDVDAVLPERCAICPACLDQFGYVRDSWDLAPVTVCVHHGSVLIDECPSCQAPIGLNRASLFHCNECALDFRQTQSRAASEKSIAVVSDFEALAPFRVADVSGRTIS